MSGSLHVQELFIFVSGGGFFLCAGSAVVLRGINRLRRLHKALDRLNGVERALLGGIGLSYDNQPAVIRIEFRLEGTALDLIDVVLTVHDALGKVLRTGLAAVLRRIALARAEKLAVRGLELELEQLVFLDEFELALIALVGAFLLLELDSALDGTLLPAARPEPAPYAFCAAPRGPLVPC